MTQTHNVPDLGVLPYGPENGMQRRHVAVLFADITGFTALVESVDPELVYEIVRPLLDELVLRVHRHGGEIQQVLGDGFMAVFGLDDAAGSAPLQAVRAGLALVSSVAGAGHPPVHVGVEYGEVLLTSAWESGGLAVWGRTVNVASRLCDLAGPGCVQVGQAAFQACGPALAAAVRESAVPVRTRPRGFSAPVLSYAVRPSCSQ